MEALINLVFELRCKYEKGESVMTVINKDAGGLADTQNCGDETIGACSLARRGWYLDLVACLSSYVKQHTAALKLQEAESPSIFVRIRPLSAD